MAAGLSTSGAVGIVVEGLPELKAAFVRLGTRGSRVAARKGLAAGLKPVVRSIRKNAKTMVGRKTGNFAKSVRGRQMKHHKTGIYQAKVGFDVGQKKFDKEGNKKRKGAHAHLVALGTKERIRKAVLGRFHIDNPTPEQGTTGRMPKGPPIVATAYAQSKSEALAAMKAKTLQSIKEETIKARSHKR